MLHFDRAGPDSLALPYALPLGVLQIFICEFRYGIKLVLASSHPIFLMICILFPNYIDDFL